MKKAVFLLAILCGLFLVTGCAQKTEDVLNLGLNAEIVEIDEANHVLYVTDAGDAGVFGERRAIDCDALIEGQNIIYVDYDTHELTDIPFSELLVGDDVIINAYDSQLNHEPDETIEVDQIQLGTQRLG